MALAFIGGVVIGYALAMRADVPTCDDGPYDDGQDW